MMSAEYPENTTRLRKGIKYLHIFLILYRMEIVLTLLFIANIFLETYIRSSCSSLVSVKEM